MRRQNKSMVDFFLNDIFITLILGLSFLIFFFVLILGNALVYDTITQPEPGACSYYGNYDLNFSLRLIERDTDCYFGSQKFVEDRAYAGFHMLPMTLIITTPIFHTLHWYYGTLVERTRKRKRK